MISPKVCIYKARFQGGRQVQKQVQATQKIYRSKDKPSNIVLPVLANPVPGEA
jgi:hypothetical protein